MVHFIALCTLLFALYKKTRRWRVFFIVWGYFDSVFCWRAFRLLVAFRISMFNWAKHF